MYIDPYYFEYEQILIWFKYIWLICCFKLFTLLIIFYFIFIIRNTIIHQQQLTLFLPSISQYKVWILNQKTEIAKKLCNNGGLSFN